MTLSCIPYLKEHTALTVSVTHTRKAYLRKNGSTSNFSRPYHDRPLAAAYPLPAALAPGGAFPGGSTRPRFTFHSRSSPGDAPIGGSSPNAPPLPLRTAAWNWVAGGARPGDLLEARPRPPGGGVREPSRRARGGEREGSLAAGCWP
eukprot:scaffold121975_cov45-Phaeocystis_antarctica.AAC.1